MNLRTARAGLVPAELLLWGVGDSRVWLWLSAALHFFVLVNLVAYPIGWLFEKLYNLTYDRR